MVQGKDRPRVIDLRACKEEGVITAVGSAGRDAQDIHGIVIG